jgi:hypothetical protein
MAMTTVTTKRVPRECRMKERLPAAWASPASECPNETEPLEGSSQQEKRPHSAHYIHGRRVLQLKWIWDDRDHQHRYNRSGGATSQGLKDAPALTVIQAPVFCVG